MELPVSLQRQSWELKLRSWESETVFDECRATLSNNIALYDYFGSKSFSSRSFLKCTCIVVFHSEIILLLAAQQPKLLLKSIISQKNRSFTIEFRSDCLHGERS